MRLESFSRIVLLTCQLCSQKLMYFDSGARPLELYRAVAEYAHDVE